VAALAAVPAAVDALSAPPLGPTSPAPAMVSEVYRKLPLTFEANDGQVDGSVKFPSRSQGTTLFLTPDEAVLSLRGPDRETTVVRLRLEGANWAPRLVGEEPQATKSNHFIGSDPRRWHVGVAHYAQVRVAGIYPGLDLLYRGNQRRLEYDLVIARPGDCPRRRSRADPAGLPGRGRDGDRASGRV
jgi:hypothetical protein